LAWRGHPNAPSSWHASSPHHLSSAPSYFHPLIVSPEGASSPPRLFRSPPRSSLFPPRPSLLSSLLRLQRPSKVGANPPGPGLLPPHRRRSDGNSLRTKRLNVPQILGTTDNCRRSTCETVTRAFSTIKDVMADRQQLDRCGSKTVGGRPVASWPGGALDYPTGGCPAVFRTHYSDCKS